MGGPVKGGFEGGSAPAPARARMLRRRGYALEAGTLAWNVAGVVVLAVVAVRTGSVAVAGFGLDSLIEIGASAVVIWELSGTGAPRQARALRMIGVAFLALAGYLVVQAAVALVAQHHAASSAAGVVWTGVTAAVMFLLAAGKASTGRELGNPVLVTEGRVTVVDGLLAVAVLVGLVLDALLGWWWADPLAALVIVGYAVREAVHLLRH
jgi:divalent metal cation (Fe/Co/Zn/Cd) transporter